ncbi:MAG: hypothetical protein K2N34_16115, partial [Lachnospiraceae bacterium]|nr:hypothetical protein [Lachnospiraceae bacterium]
MRKLYIITDEFPYGTGEKTFILPELFVLKKFFKITIISTASSKVIEQKELVTKLDDTIRIFCFDPTERNYQYVKNLFMFWTKKVCWMEVRDIIKTQKKVMLRIWKSMHFYARAEAMYRWLRMSCVIDKDEGIYYSYWYTSNVLAITMHRNSYPKLKVITRTHGYDLYDERAKGILRQPFKRVMDMFLDNIIFASHYGYLYYLDRMKLSPSAKYVVYKIGASEAQKKVIHEECTRFRIVSCSNIIPLKRVSLIIDSLNKIHDFAIEWIHFGDGENRLDIENYARKKLGEKDNITYQ